MLDTSVYEFLVLDRLDDLTKKIEEGKIIVYGCSIVRKELRETSKSAKLKGKSFRNALLSAYDSATDKHSYPAESIVDFIAEEYWKEYEGGISKRKFMNDFRIVALASIHNLDIIVSEDNHSMKSGMAIETYRKVNQRNGFRTPVFYSINQLLI
ncbi:MAG TPA: hypothetical protein VJG83_02120 [archaeon]|nr:hypothetical protein [archaeon]